MRIRALPAALLLTATIVGTAGAQAFGTHAVAATSQIDYWYWGNWLYTNDCLHGTLPCGSGPQSSSTPKSSSSATPTLGRGVVSTYAAGATGGYGGLTPNLISSQANAESMWWDTFIVNSSVSALGTIVTVDVSILFNSQGSGLNSAWYTSALLGLGGESAGILGVRHGYQGAGGATLNTTVSTTFQAAVGTPFMLFGTSRAWATSDGGAGPGQFASSAQSDFYVDVGNGLWLSTASGTNYGSLVAPEPATLALLLPAFGLVALGVRRKRGA